MTYCTLIDGTIQDVKVIEWHYLDNKELVLVSFLNNKCQFVVEYRDLLVK